MASAFIQPPLHFKPGDDPPSAWEEWREAYTICELLYPAADSDDADSVKYILDKFDELHCPYKNVIQAAALFNSRVRTPGQSIDNFVIDLPRQAQKCDFGDKCDRLIGDRIVVGIRDGLRDSVDIGGSVLVEKTVLSCLHAHCIVLPTKLARNLFRYVFGDAELRGKSLYGKVSNTNKADPLKEALYPLRLNAAIGYTCGHFSTTTFDLKNSNDK
ncbi:hypothetical protein HPB49_016983 [Dermacentor silvarum]|uniref:Uncharacterized protein n=1 Tax=Dermacentor silvarum TaxID=543639 RepID=A0ACB8DQ50_DERSI|nr:hypothetical protein HPB49_016983 [Dermacentor silvarum]